MTISVQKTIHQFRRHHRLISSTRSDKDRCELFVGQWNANVIISNSVQHPNHFASVQKFIRWISCVQKTPSQWRRLNITTRFEVTTLSRDFWVEIWNSFIAASMQASTASAKWFLMPRIISSTFGLDLYTMSNHRTKHRSGQTRQTAKIQDESIQFERFARSLLWNQNNRQRWLYLAHAAESHSGRWRECANSQLQTRGKERHRTNILRRSISHRWGKTWSSPHSAQSSAKYFPSREQQNHCHTCHSKSLSEY